MMKKLSKLALLAVAAAFLVATLPACSSGSGGEGDTAQGGGSGTGGGGSGSGSGGSGSGGGSGSSSVNAVWDFSAASLTTVGLTTTAIPNPRTDNIAPKSGSGATLKFKSSELGKSVKIQNADTGGLNIGAGTTESDILVITVDAACTLSFTGKGSTGEGSWGSNSNINSFSVKDTNVYTRKEANETSSQTWKYKCDTAGEYTIKAGGMIFTELKCE